MCVNIDVKIIFNLIKMLKEINYCVKNKFLSEELTQLSRRVRETIKKEEEKTYISLCI